jgi:hypothetical protein
MMILLHYDIFGNIDIFCPNIANIMMFYNDRYVENMKIVVIK